MSLEIKLTHYSKKRSVPIPKESPLIVSSDKSIVPIFSIGIMNEEPRTSRYLDCTELGKSIMNNEFPNSVLCYIANKISKLNSYSDFEGYINRFFYSMTDEEKEITLIKAIRDAKEELNSYFDSPIKFNAFDGVPSIRGDYFKYSSVTDHFWNSNGFGIMRTRDPRFKYVVGPYYLAHYDFTTGNTIPIVSLVTQTKFVKLIRYYHVMGKPVPSKYLQLWVKDGFDIKDSQFKNLRPSYRKFIRKPILEANIKIAVKPDLSMLFSKFQGIPCSSLNEYNEFLSDCSEEILSHLREETGFFNAEEIREKNKENEEIAEEQLG